MTDREFAEGIALLCATVGKEITADQMRAWQVMFDDLTAEQFRFGIIKTIRTYTFAGFPPIGTIRDNCGVKSGVIAAKDRPTLAWEAVRRAISQVGGYDSPDFDDPSINAAIRAIGGWVALCDSTADELVWREKDFVRNYSVLSALRLETEQTKRLSGITERENGSAIPAPVVCVGCLTVGSIGVRRIPHTSPERLSGPLVAAESLAKRLSFDDREPESPAKPNRSQSDQLAALLNFRKS